MGNCSVGRLAALVVAGTATLGVVGCGNSTTKPGKPGSSASTSAPIVFAEFRPLSGSSAAFAPPHLAACYAAVTAIKNAGGVLGDKHVSCSGDDTRGDPADAVPAAQKMLATTSGLVAVDGPTSSEASATVPIIDAAHIPMFATTGQASFNVNHYPYFYRVQPADNSVGFAMALHAHGRGFTRAAVVFGQDITAAGSESAAVQAFQSLGGTIVGTANIAEDQSSYSTDMARIAASHPQVILTETDPQTAATFLTELAQINGSLIPILGTDGTANAAYYTAVEGAVGKSAFVKAYTGMTEYAPPTGPAYDGWASSLRQAAANFSSMPKPITPFLTDSFAMGGYDALLVTALAMDEAKSTNPEVFSKDIVPIANGSPGAAVVHTYAQGQAMLKQGRKVHYVGAIGQIHFDSYHNSPGQFAAIAVDARNLAHVLQIIPGPLVSALALRFHG